MISTKVMDFKLREAAEGLGEDGTGKKKSKFKTFKKFFGKKKRKESPASTGSGAWKQSQAKSEVIALESGPVGYDSEDELGESRAALGSRALSHESIFIPESGQDPPRPVRVFSQENVCDRIKALQVKIQCNVKMGLPPPPGRLPAQRGDDAGMSSEDDGLPRSPPEMSLLPDTGPGTTIKEYMNFVKFYDHMRRQLMKLNLVAFQGHLDLMSHVLGFPAIKCRTRNMAVALGQVSLASSSRPPSPDQPSSGPTSDVPVLPQTLDGSVAPVADFSHPPKFSSCLDNSAAKHKLLVKPRNQRSSKMRRLSSRAQSECLGYLMFTPEEEEADDQPLPTLGSEDRPGAGQQDAALGGGLEPRGPAAPLPPGGPRARRARLQHCPAISASAEGDSLLGDHALSRPATPEATEPTEPTSAPAPGLELPLLAEGSAHLDPNDKNQRAEPPLESACPLSEDTADEAVCASGDVESSVSPRTPEEEAMAPGTGPTLPLEAASGPDGPDHAVEKEAEPTPVAPSPWGAETPAAPSPRGAEAACSEDHAPSPPPPKSCLKHKALVASRSLSVSPNPPTSEPPPEEPTPCALDKETTAVQSPEQGSPREPPKKEALEQKIGRGGSEPRGVKKFSVSSGRAWPRTGHRERLGHPGPAGPTAVPNSVRLPLLRSGLAWRNEAALDDFRMPLGGQHPKSDPPEPPSEAECGSQDAGSRVAGQAGPGQNPQDVEAAPVTRDPCPVVAQEPLACGDRSPFPVKLRSTSLSLRHRGVSLTEGKGVKRHSAEVRLQGGLAPLPKGDKCHVGTAPTTRGPRSPNDQGKGKARSSEPLGSKPPLPRKPLLQTLTLPCPPASPDDVSPGESEKVMPAPGPRKESRTVEKRLPHQGAEKGPPAPPWIAVTPPKRRGAPERPPQRQDKPGAQTLKSEPGPGMPAKAPQRAQEPVKQADFVRSKSFLVAPAKPAVDRRQQGPRRPLQEGLQRGISLSHQNLAAQSEKELHQLKRASYASTDQPSWMELARKKSQAWSDLPQIIK